MIKIPLSFRILRYTKQNSIQITAIILPIPILKIRNESSLIIAAGLPWDP